MMCEPADSTPETLQHARRVADLMSTMIGEAIGRSQRHDHSKMVAPEKWYFDEATGRLATLTYGTQAYQDSLDAIRPGVEHHYQENRHHPEHFPGGVNDMNLVDVLEMLADWKAASERTKGGSLNLEFTAGRHGVDPQLARIMQNTVRDLGW